MSEFNNYEILSKTTSFNFNMFKNLKVVAEISAKVTRGQHLLAEHVATAATAPVDYCNYMLLTLLLLPFNGHFFKVTAH